MNEYINSQQWTQSFLNQSPPHSSIINILLHLCNISNPDRIASKSFVMLFTLSLIFSAVLLPSAVATPAKAGHAPAVTPAAATLAQRDCSHDNCLRGSYFSILTGGDSQYWRPRSHYCLSISIQECDCWLFFLLLDNDHTGHLVCSLFCSRRAPLTI